MQSLDNGSHLGLDYGIVDRGARTAGVDKSVASQPHELLRHRNLFDVEGLAQLGHGFFSIHQRAKHQKTLRMGQAPHQVGSQRRRRDHFFYIHSIEIISFEC